MAPMNEQFRLNVLTTEMCQSREEGGGGKGERRESAKRGERGRGKGGVRKERQKTQGG